MSVLLEHIVIFNFKSYRGEIIFGPMKPFMAIVGANGAGKSNVMDAISFVMGERASNLRVKQLSDLIYGAPVGKPIAQSAHVTAIFTLKDNGSRSFTRSIHGNICEYKVNDEVVTAQSYMSELKKLGLNVKAKNFLIFQGAVEFIITKTPKEICLLIEEISTSGELKADYERLRDEVRKAENEVQYITQKRRDCFAKKKYAILEKKEAEKYENLHKQYLKTKTELQLFEMYHVKADIEELETEAKEKQQRVDDYENDKNLADELLRQKKKNLGMLSRDLAKAEQDLVRIENTFRKKEANFVTIHEQVLYWRKKLESSNSLLASSYKAEETRVKTIQELEAELLEVENMKTSFIQSTATQLMSQGRSVELNDIQVQEYFRLKKVAQQQSLKYVQSSDLLKQEQIRDQNKLDNVERKKAEFKSKLNQKRITKDEAERRFSTLRAFIDETENVLTDKMKRKSDLEATINTRRDKIQKIQDELQEVSEQLGDAILDNHTFLRMKKKVETITTLRGLFAGVYGRLSEMCKPIHSRYNIAATKVFGKYVDAIVVDTSRVATQCIYYLKEQQMDRETFLPLDALKVKPIKEKLRDIKEPKHMKLLYDVLQFSPEVINKAVLFVTNNTLVCETPEDASTVAYKTDPHHRHNCVAIDGTLYRKDGMISGGQVELSKRAKVWDEEHLSELKIKKGKLVEELKQLSKISQLESEKCTLELQVSGLKNRLKYSKYSFDETEKQIVTVKKEIEALQKELQTIYTEIASIKGVMEERNQSIRSIERQINIIEDNVFEYFCENVGIGNIREYEKGDLKTHQEQTRRQVELEEQCNRIRNLLEFERERNAQNTMLKYEAAAKNAREKLEAACEVETMSKIDVTNEQRNLEDQRATCKAIKDKVTDMEQSVNECRHQLGKIARLIQDSERERTITLTKIEKKKAEWHAILKNCKVEGIAIPLLCENTRSSDGTSQTSALNQSTTLSTIDLNEQEMFTLIDFSKLPESVKSREERDIYNFRNEITKEIVELQNAMKSMHNINFKANEKLHLTIEELENTNVEFLEARKRATQIKREFEELKHERYKRFMHCMDHIVQEVDVTYKHLVRDESAQAILLCENFEEPYLGGVNYSCIAPGKRFQPLLNLSGGEKTLAALALLFAIHSFRPTPFFVLDEVDAALDNINIRNVVHFIRSKADVVQFIVISLKRELFSHADALVGICSKPNTECPESLMYILELTQYPESCKK